MATNTKIAPFREIDEHDVVNLFSWSGAIPVTAGTIVKMGGSGWRTDETDTQLLGPVGASYPNTLSLRFGVQPYCVAAGTGDPVLGVLLQDVREQDENGVQLKLYKQKAYENMWSLSGEAVPVLTRGWLLVSGQFNGSVTAGALAYPSGQGEITTNSLNQSDTSVVGRFYGAPGANSFALLHVNCR